MISTRRKYIDNIRSNKYREIENLYINDYKDNQNTLGNFRYGGI